MSEHLRKFVAYLESTPPGAWNGQATGPALRTGRMTAAPAGSNTEFNHARGQGGADASGAAQPNKSVAPPSHAQASLAKAPKMWHSTRGVLDAKVSDLKNAIRQEFAGEGPELIAGIEKTVSKLDVILDKLDHRLADSLAKAHAAEDPTARQAELKNSKAILTE